MGKKREINQDVVFSSELPVGNLPDLFMIADGMGGRNGGEFASGQTVSSIVRFCEDSPEENIEQILQSAISMANDAVFRQSREDKELEGMGTTLVACSIAGNLMKVANVGDSRLYLIRGRKITQITRDHSLVEEMVRLGEIDRSSARNHPKKNIITRAIGVTASVTADFFDVSLEKGDMVLLCSDGLSNMLEDEEIRMIMTAQRDIIERAEALVRAANNNGGKDNISVIILEPFADEVKHD
ncbi:MAG: Stp1/IreP family PP2C-type Ser/Thr phosphatase [Lachnospiraceae bacterium]|nr:Stp1/IreP family PP2C-type Ser/Thr phosphatase [Lachnospiraceae bacterium]